MNDHVPAYVHHRPTGQARVRIKGRDFYLGPFRSKASRIEYDRLIGEWLANGRRLAQPDRSSEVTVNRVLAAFIDHAEQHYRKNGQPTGEAQNFVYALAHVRRLYGQRPATEFRGLALKTVREKMIAAGDCRNRINRQVSRIKHVFKWAVANELIPPDSYQALVTVEGLDRGRSNARESFPVRPVDEQYARAIFRFVSPQVRAMIELQLLTGMRPGEVVLMRNGDIDRSRATWVYRPATHKTEHHGFQRQVVLGPRAQEVIRPFLKQDGGAYLFSPKEAQAIRHARQRDERRTPLTPSQRARKPMKRPRIAPADHYPRESYANAIRRACLFAGVVRWHPNQLRHTAATMLRKRYGLEVARAALGHRSAVTTERYAEVDTERVAEVMQQVG